MIRRLALLILFGTGLVLRAQTETWQAWLYHPGGEMTLIDGGGYIRDQLTLPLPTGYDRYSFDLTVSSDGTRAAYLAANFKGEQHLMVHHLERDRLLLDYPLPPILTDGITFVTADADPFHPDTGSLAFGFSQPDGGWQIQVIDVQTGFAAQILRSGSGNVSAAGIPATAGLTPVIRRFSGTRVLFTLAQVQGGVDSGAGGYVWDIQTNGLNAAPQMAALDSDTFAITGEIIFPLLDESVAEANFSQPNALYLYDPLLDDSFPIYASADRGLLGPRFVQNGEAALVNSFDQEGRPRFLILGRNGTIQGEWQPPQGMVLSSLRGTAEGFAYTANTIDPGGKGTTTLFGLNTYAGLNEGAPLYTSAPGTQPRIVWLGDARFGTGTRAVWTRYTPEIAAPAATPTAVSTPAGSVSIPEWQAWIYEDSGRTSRVDHQGRLLDVAQLPFPLELSDPSAQSYPAKITTSRDGRILAGVFSQDGLPRYLSLYDTSRDATLLTYTLPHDGSSFIPAHTIDRAPQHMLFNEGDTALAFGFGLGESGWQISVIDLVRGEAVAALRHDSPAMQPFGVPADFGLVPVIQRYEENTVFFTLFPAGPLEPPYLSFAWSLSANTVSPNLIYAGAQTDTFDSTGEVIMAMIDPRLQNTASNFLYGQLNALHVYDPRSGTRFPFYNSAELWLFRPEFIQNGERILAGGSDPSGAFVGRAVIERDGTLVGILPLSSATWDESGTGDGLIYLPRDEARPDDLLLMAINTRDGLDIGTLVWQTTRQGKAQIAWVGYASQQRAQPAWAQLAPPLVTVGIIPTQAAPARLAAGGSATIRTVGGDALYVRVEPGRSGQIATRLNSGTRVMIVAGPRPVDGENWWQIRTPSGVEGWVIESADGIRTLVPD